MDIVFWSIITTAGIGALCSAAWMLGYFKNQEAKQRAREQAELERMRGDAKAREAEIYSKPSRDKPTIVRRMRDKQ